MGSRSRIAAAAALGYLVGTIPVADIATRLAQGRETDLRDHGSGNPGGANAAAVLGPRWGYAVMAADVSKGALAGLAGRALGGASGANAGATGAVVGHCWPAWNGFRGGKGVAASIGQCLATFPAFVPIDVAVSAATMALPWWQERAFAATAAGSVSWVVASMLWSRYRWPNLWGPEPTTALPLAASMSSAVILHRFWLAAR